LQAAHASATAAKDANIEKLDHEVAQLEAAAATKDAVISELQVSLATRFVATAAEDAPTWGAIPGRSVPTAPDSSVVQLFPAVSAANAGAVLRFV
jgi:ribosomal protein L9